ncbi:unnamed protein product [Brassicogethes aeneus]|uniref:Farnesol dehydrogenase-like n=1 Tax=Brassicogethes aeneus TaxID=1431903 RepID=A0A9P0BDT5_BRAAE|nr:unnamed protein product [Brassicogethes aeneus]
MLRWKNKIAVVTGANQGIGYGIAKELVKHGIKVVSLDIETSNVEDLSDEHKYNGLIVSKKVDVREEQEVVDAFQWIKKHIGPVSILINSAGVLETTNLSDGNADIWKNTLLTNVHGLNLCTREAVRCLKQNGDEGHIIHLNSICGHFVPQIENFNVYPASKYAVTALTEGLRRELAKLKANIKVSSISPGIVKTKMLEVKLKTDPMYKNIPFLPLLEVDDVVESVIYVLGTPPNIQVHELIIKPLHEFV